MNTRNTKMVSGTYYIGDPSYITKGEEGYIWIEKLWELFYGANKKSLNLEVDGVNLFIGSTYGGDGIYDDFYIDSGTLMVLRINDLPEDERFNFRKLDIRGARFITFDNEFHINYDDGLFQIGDLITIDTRF